MLDRGQPPNWRGYPDRELLAALFFSALNSGVSGRWRVTTHSSLTSPLNTSQHRLSDMLTKRANIPPCALSNSSSTRATMLADAESPPSIPSGRRLRTGQHFVWPSADCRPGAEGGIGDGQHEFGITVLRREHHRFVVLAYDGGMVGGADSEEGATDILSAPPERPTGSCHKTTKDR